MILTRDTLDAALRKADDEYEAAKAAGDADKIHAAIRRGVRLNRVYDVYEAAVIVAVHFPDGDQQMTLREARDFLGLYEETRKYVSDELRAAMLPHQLAIDAAVGVGSENKLDTEFFGVGVDESLFA